MSYWSFILPWFFVNKAPHALIANTKSNQSQGRGATLLKVLRSCFMSRYRWEGRCLRLRTSTSKPCHIICWLGSGLDSVDGVKAMFLEPTFRLSSSQVGRAWKCTTIQARDSWYLLGHVHTLDNQTLTQRGANLGNIILDGSSFISHMLKHPYWIMSA